MPRRRRRAARRCHRRPSGPAAMAEPPRRAAALHQSRRARPTLRARSALNFPATVSAAAEGIARRRRDGCVARREGFCPRERRVVLREDERTRRFASCRSARNARGARGPRPRARARRAASTDSSAPPPEHLPAALYLGDQVLVEVTDPVDREAKAADAALAAGRGAGEGSSSASTRRSAPQVSAAEADLLGDALPLLARRARHANIRRRRGGRHGDTARLERLVLLLRELG